MNDSFGPIKKTRVAENLAMEIKHRILKGSLNPGDKLPSERDLAKQCSTSRITVRETFRLLENEGLLIIKQGIDGGAFITEVDHKTVEHSLGVFFRYGDVSIEKLMETRLIIEPEIARLAAAKRTNEDLKELKDIIDDCQTLLDRQKPDMNIHLQFHSVLAKSSQNPLLMAISNSVIRYLGNIVRTANTEADYHYHTNDQKFHRDIYTAVKNHHKNKAQKAMIEHIEVFSEQLSRDYQPRK
jgi:GntR family transcriptional repressor for pyruvate dehydrogenase complex